MNIYEHYHDTEVGGYAMGGGFLMSLWSTEFNIYYQYGQEWIEQLVASETLLDDDVSETQDMFNTFTTQRELLLIRTCILRWV